MKTLKCNDNLLAKFAYDRSVKAVEGSESYQSALCGVINHKNAQLHIAQLYHLYDIMCQAS